MLAHVVIEVLDLVKLDRAHGAHVGGPLLAACFRSHAHSGAHDSAPGPAPSRRHGQGHHSRSRLGNGHRDWDGHGASDASCGTDPGDPGDPRGPGPGAVQGHVALQQGLVGELLLADVALVGLLSAVQAHVDVEGALLGEAFVADAALVRSDSCMCNHVFDKIILQRERTPADAALVRLFTCKSTEHRLIRKEPITKALLQKPLSYP